MITKKIQVEIMNLFLKDIFLKKTIREIALLLEKDYPNIHGAVKELEKLGFIQTESIGNSRNCSIKLNRKVISLFSFLDEQKAFSKNIPNINEILENKEFNEDIILVTGSYAEEKQTRTSDIDLVLIVGEKAFEKQKLLESLTSLKHPRFHALVFSYKDYIEMLQDKKPNLGQEIFKKKLIFKNAERYYNIIKEAIENGFRG